MSSGEEGSIASLTLSVSARRSGQAAPLLHPPLGENVAPLASGIAYIRGPEDHLIVDEEAYLAIDGDPETIWSSKQPAPQWYAINLDRTYLVDRVEMVVTQAPPGPTTHEIWLGHGSGLRTFYKRLADVHTEDGQILAVPIDPPQAVNEVLILTLHSPSWVAWRDFRVFGSQLDAPVANEVAPPYKVAEVAAGLEFPVRVTHAGDGSGRIFVVELPGRIRIVQDGAVNETPFLDISERVNCCEGERGMFGLAFPPSYPESGHFYVSYTGSQGATTISRFATTDDPNRADENSEQIILTIGQPHENHNGGHLAFGPQDGFLYIGSGDGGLPRDPENRGQTTDTLLGKLLRIDVESGELPYGIPADNPFGHEVCAASDTTRPAGLKAPAGQCKDGYRPEIWALGLRNPWGFAFDKRSGDLYLPDTGNFKREEVNFQPAGAGGGQNYGWPVMEGSICFEHDVLTCSAQGLVLPVADYDRTHGCAIVGGAVYGGDTFPGLHGAFIFADFCTSRIWSIGRSEGDAALGNLRCRTAKETTTIHEEHEGSTKNCKREKGRANFALSRRHLPALGEAQTVKQTSWRSMLLASAGMPISSVGADEEGNVYFTVHAKEVGAIYTLRAVNSE